PAATAIYTLSVLDALPILVIASERAQLVLAFGRIGLVPEVGTNWALTRRVGYQKAFELFVRGGVIDAGKALELGLVNEVVPHERDRKSTRLNSSHVKISYA